MDKYKIYKIYNSIIDLFSKVYQGIKSNFWQLIPGWSSGLIIWLTLLNKSILLYTHIERIQLTMKTINDQ